LLSILLAIRLQLGVIDCLTGNPLDRAFDFCRRFGDPILVEDFFSKERPLNGRRERR
jgi:hypothetical protein